jgi:hypothetical protein
VAKVGIHLGQLFEDFQGFHAACRRQALVSGLPEDQGGKRQDRKVIVYEQDRTHLMTSSGPFNNHVVFPYVRNLWEHKNVLPEW